MLFDKHKAAQIILSKKDSSGKESSSPQKPEEAVDHDFQGLHIAAQDMIHALHNKSPQDLHKALHSYLELRTQLEPGEKPDDKSSSNEKGSEDGAQYSYNR